MPGHGAIAIRREPNHAAPLVVATLIVRLLAHRAGAASDVLSQNDSGVKRFGGSTFNSGTPSSWPRATQQLAESHLTKRRFGPIVRGSNDSRGTPQCPGRIRRKEAHDVPVSTSHIADRRPAPRLLRCEP